MNLYSNKELLKKYNKNVPQNLNELITTAEEILSKENKVDLIGYKGLFGNKFNIHCSYNNNNVIMKIE